MLFGGRCGKKRTKLKKNLDHGLDMGTEKIRIWKYAFLPVGEFPTGKGLEDR
jgi:hypothetical protein